MGEANAKAARQTEVDAQFISDMSNVLLEAELEATM